MEFERRVTQPTEELLAGFRAVVINGPRQAGKSTLVRQVQRNRGPVITLDDPGTRDAAVTDPVGLLRGQPDHIP